MFVRLEKKRHCGTQTRKAGECLDEVCIAVALGLSAAWFGAHLKSALRRRSPLGCVDELSFSSSKSAASLPCLVSAKLPLRLFLSKFSGAMMEASAHVLIIVPCHLCPSSGCLSSPLPCRYPVEASCLCLCWVSSRLLGGLLSGISTGCDSNREANQS